MREVERFFWRWRLSDYTLTVTGSYERDQELYSDFWDDVELFNTLYKVQESIVQKIIDESKS